MPRPQEHTKNMTEIALVILFLIGAAAFLWFFQFSNDSSISLFNKTVESEPQQSPPAEEVVNHFSGVITQIKGNSITALPVSPPGSSFNYENAFPASVEIRVTDSTQFTVVEISEEEAKQAALAEYKRQIDALPPGTGPADYPPYPNLITSIRLTIKDFTPGEHISVKSKSNIVGQASFEATTITK